VPDLKKLFQYCPSCGSQEIRFDGLKEFRCAVCSFTYYHNVATGVGAILDLAGKILLIRRGKDPGKGRLDLPGGFVDPGESAEEALRREIQEELGIDAGPLEYVGSYPNVYEYRSVVYRTCDVFFHSRIDSLPTSLDQTEVQEMVLTELREVPLDEIAFQSVRACLSRFLEIRRKRDAV
jgi:ADP-ribose pyrophosphatase YjhB (NUDIX family)